MIREVAVIGAGLAGLATSYFLSLSRKVNVTLFDPEGMRGGGASAIAAGLVHPYFGLHMRRSWEAARGLEETEQLAQLMRTHRRQGALKLAHSLEQQQEFSLYAQSHADVEWWPAEKIERLVPGVCAPHGALFLKGAFTLCPQTYLENLGHACLTQGVRVEKRALSSLGELSGYAAIVVAAGAGTLRLLPRLPLYLVKGQLLHLAWPAGLPPLPYDLLGPAYVALLEKNASFVLGATYERKSSSLSAEKELRKRLRLFFPALEQAPLLSCHAAFRVVPPDRRTPLVGPFASDPPCWVFTGLGSRGLLYHAWLAKQLAQAILEESVEPLPYEVRWRLCNYSRSLTRDACEKLK